MFKVTLKDGTERIFEDKESAGNFIATQQKKMLDWDFLLDITITKI